MVHVGGTRGVTWGVVFIRALGFIFFLLWLTLHYHYDQMLVFFFFFNV